MVGDSNIVLTTTIETLGTATRLEIDTIFTPVKKTIVTGTNHFGSITINKVGKTFSVESARSGRKVFASHEDPRKN